MTPRDTQRSKVYAAEQAAFHRPDWKADAPTLAEAKALVRKVERTATWAKLCDRGGTISRSWPPVQVKPGRNGGMAYGSWGITLGVYGRQPWLVLHEMAHIATVRRYGSSGAAPHGWQFCDTYLRLVRRFLGADAHAELRAQFKAHRVRYTAPRTKRQLTPEQKAELVERLARARAARPQQ